MEYVPHLSTLTLLLLLHLKATSAASPRMTITGICTNISSSNPNIHLGFCKATFAPFKRKCIITTFTLEKLSLYSLKASVASASSTKRYLLHRLSKSKLDEYTEESLSICKKVYVGSIMDLNIAKKAIKKGHYDDALTYLSGAMNAATTCDEGFVDKEIVNPMKKKVEELFQLTAITLAIVNLLK